MLQKIKRQIVYEQLREIVNRCDPIGIAEIDIDEYEPKIRTILARVEEGMEQEDLERVVQEVFESYFFKDYASVNVYKNIAREFYLLLQGE